MAIKLGDKDISKIMLGDRPIKKVMLGDRLVWESYQGNIIKGTTIQPNQTLIFVLNGANISVTSNNNGEWEYRTTDAIQRLKFNTTSSWQVALKSVDLSKVDFSSLITTDEMFLRCAKVQEIKGFSWIPNTIRGFTSTFNGFSRDTPYMTSLDLSQWEINGTTTAMFAQGGFGLSDLRIGKIFVTLNLSTMPLNLQSAINILDALQEVSTPQTITFSAYTTTLINESDVALGKVFDAIRKGWSIVGDGLIQTDDVAFFNDSETRMPTLAEWQELQQHTTITNVEIQGVKCFKLQSKNNTNSITIPCGGFYTNYVIYNIGRCYMWNSTIHPSYTEAKFSIINENGELATNSYSQRRNGMNVRAVSETKGVDLGLPSGIKWMPCNVGATQPQEIGGYYSWGELSPKSTYSWSNYKFNPSGDTTPTLTKYNATDGLTTLQIKY